jgi:hypothetical protein
MERSRQIGKSPNRYGFKPSSTALDRSPVKSEQRRPVSDQEQAGAGTQGQSMSSREHHDHEPDDDQG